MAPPQLAEEQINCGPFFEDVDIGGRYLSLATPHGKYDLAAIAQRLPLDQQPDVVVCLVDACGRNLPSNLAAFKCPKILLLADTHHMVRPIVSMIQYAKAERFDRIVFLYTRHHIDIFRSAGIRNVHWLPSLTLPYSDATVRGVRQQERDSCLAHVGYLGALHYRRLRLAGRIASEKLPFVLKEIPQREALKLYGSSLIGLNVTANSDLNLRAFETMAAGAMLLMDRLASDSGVAQLWQEGRELVTYDTADDMVEKARYYLSHPAEAREIGQAGEQWFDRFYSGERRQALFRDLVFDGAERPEFVVPVRQKPLIQFGGQPALMTQALLVYEFVQTMHSCQEVVRIVIDEGAPEDFRALCETLPRVEVRSLERAAPGIRSPTCSIDFLVVSASRAAAFATAGAKGMWCWNATAADLPIMRQRLAAAGLRQLDQDVAFFCRLDAEVTPTVLEGSKSAKARLIMRGGALPLAFEVAKQAIAEAPGVADSHIIMAEIAVELSNRETVTRTLAKARSLEPANPRIPLVEMMWEGGKPRQVARWLDIAYKALDAKELPKALDFANRALAAAPQHAPALFLLGAICLSRASQEAGGIDWRYHLRALQALQAAAEAAPERADYWHSLALAQRRAGFFRKAVVGWERSLALDASQPLAWFGLGESYLRLGDAVRAQSSFERGLEVSPGDRMLMRWLGHACLRLGSPEGAWRWHARSFGAVSENLETAQNSRSVVFVVATASEWLAFEPVLEAAAECRELEARVVVLPVEQTDAEALFCAIKNKGITFDTASTLTPEAGFAGMVVLGNASDSTRPECWRISSLLATGARLGYLPHDLPSGPGGVADDRVIWDSELARVASLVFACDEADRVRYGRRCLCGNSHVVVTGHPKLDFASRSAPNKNVLMTFAAGRPLVCWNPHYDVRLDGSDVGSGRSTFLRWMNFIPDEVARRPGLALVIRPHPKLIQTLAHQGIFTATEIEELFHEFEKTGNIYIDRDLSPKAALDGADALVSDPSSLLIEFVKRGKPAAILTSPSFGNAVQGIGGHSISSIETEAELRHFLDGASRWVATRTRSLVGSCSSGKKVLEQLIARTGGRTFSRSSSSCDAGPRGVLSTTPLYAPTAHP